MIYVNRILACLLQLVIVIDELVEVIIRSPIYIFTGYNMPSAHETISAWVGSNAARGYKWAVEAAKLIDGVFGKNHCANQTAYEASVDTPV